MMPALAGEAPAGDAMLALQLLLSDLGALGGIMLTGGGPARDALIAGMQDAMADAGPVRRIPASIDIERLTGGLDLAATLATGRAVTRPGILAEAAGGIVILPMAERIAPEIAVPVASAVDAGQCAAILLDDRADEAEAPPILLTERMAFHCDLSLLRDVDPAPARPDRHELANVAPLDDEQRAALIDIADAMDVGSMRALLFAQRAALAHAALHGRDHATDDDLAAAVRLVLAPRARRAPPPPAEPPQPDAATPPADPPPPEPSDDAGDRTADDPPPQQQGTPDLDDILLAAAAAALPRRLLGEIDGNAGRTARGRTGRGGGGRKPALRGRPMGARPGIPGDGRRLALMDSLRAAIPWQGIRRRDAAPGDVRPIQLRKSDLRIRAFRERREALTVFAVDASGSSAMNRLAEAKGAVELMLAEAYVKRAQVALVAFRHQGAEILLPATRSLTRARRALAALPGGGGTPLAAGLIAAQALAEAGHKRGQSPVVAILTDGKANVTQDGRADRVIAMAEAMDAARSIAAAGIASIVIDISARARPEAAQLAHALGGRYLPLPMAGSAAMVAAIDRIGAELAA
ncbi:VWA domain-containing protein [Sphingomonas sp. CJ99]